MTHIKYEIGSEEILEDFKSQFDALLEETLNRFIAYCKDRQGAPNIYLLTLEFLFIIKDFTIPEVISFHETALLNLNKQSKC